MAGEIHKFSRGEKFVLSGKLHKIVRNDRAREEKSNLHPEILGAERGPT